LEKPWDGTLREPAFPTSPTKYGAFVIGTRGTEIKAGDGGGRRHTRVVDYNLKREQRGGVPSSEKTARRHTMGVVMGLGHRKNL